MENAGHPSADTPTATNYFLQYISSRCVSRCQRPAWHGDAGGREGFCQRGVCGPRARLRPRIQVALRPLSLIPHSGHNLGWARVVGLVLGFTGRLRQDQSSVGLSRGPWRLQPSPWSVPSVLWTSCPEQNRRGQRRLRRPLILGLGTWGKDLIMSLTDMAGGKATHGPAAPPGVSEESVSRLGDGRVEQVEGGFPHAVGPLHQGELRVNVFNGTGRCVASCL
uniref:Ranbp3 protein n=1 Tax=Homo sapiens TaxID=9606 RepID=O75761_HUMAN|nr:ranbp3 [Homo sapiens]